MERERKSAGGIILATPDKAELETRSDLVEIISAGDDAFTNCFGNKNKIPEKEQYAFIQRNTGQPFRFNKTMYRLVSSDHIIGTMEADFAKEYVKSEYSIDLETK